MAVFGQVLYLNYDSGTIVFVAVMFALMAFEGILHVIEVECTKRGLKGLVKKMYREFMIMGFISFAILLASEITSISATDKWYQSFHFAHVVILFIGITFMIQSGLLVSLIYFRNRTLLSHDNVKSEDLLNDYFDMNDAGGITKAWFNYGPISIPIPELREKVEYKILQDFFIRAYNLPYEFKFANYMCQTLKNYIISLVEVRPISWLTLAALVALNYIRILLIDPVFESEVCRHFPADIERGGAGEGGGHRRRLLLDAINNIVSVGIAMASTSSTSDASSDVSTADYWNEEDVQHGYLSGMTLLGSSSTTSPVESSNSTSHEGSDYGSRVCHEYTLRYTLVCEFLIFFYLLGVLIASDIYFQRLLDIVIAPEKSRLVEELQELHDKEMQLQHQQSLLLERNKRSNSVESNGMNIFPEMDEIRMESEPVERDDGNGHPGSAKLERSNSAKQRFGSFLTSYYMPATSAANKAEINRTDSDENMHQVILAATSTKRPFSMARIDAQRRSNSLDNGTSMYQGAAHPPVGPNSPLLAQRTARAMSRDFRSNSVRRSNSNEERSSSMYAAPPTSPTLLSADQRKTSLFFPGIGRENSVASKSSFYDNGGNGDGGNGNTPVTSSKHTQIISNALKTRSLYIRCLERLMNTEYDFHAHQARRMSMSTMDPEIIISGINRGKSSPSNPPTYHASQPPPSPFQPHASTHTTAATNHGDHESNPHNSATAHGKIHAFTLQTVFSRHSSQANVPINLHQDISKITSHHHLVGPSDTDHGTGKVHTNTFRESIDEMKEDFIDGVAPEDVSGRFSDSTRSRSHSMNSNQRGIANESFYAPSQHSSEAGSVAVHPPQMPPVIRRPSTGSVDHHEEIGDAAFPPAPPRLHQTRKRGYSAHFFEVNTEVAEAARQQRQTESTTNATQGSHDHGDDEEQQKEKEHASMISSWQPWIDSMTLLGQKTWELVKSYTKRSLRALVAHHIGQRHEDVKTDADVRQLEKELSTIFLYQNPDLYYYCVEMALLIQCLYIALWATNFVVMAADSYYPVLWEIALVVPLPINFFILKQVIYTSCMIRSIANIDQYAANKICEEAVDERNVTQRLRRVIRDSLKKTTPSIARGDWNAYLYDVYAMYSTEDLMMNPTQFKSFLHSLQIYLTSDSIRRLFAILDSDKDGKISWEMLSPIVFPELQRKTLKISKQRKVVSEIIASQKDASAVDIGVGESSIMSCKAGDQVCFEYVVNRTESNSHHQTMKSHKRRESSSKRNSLFGDAFKSIRGSFVNNMMSARELPNAPGTSTSTPNSAATGIELTTPNHQSEDASARIITSNTENDTTTSASSKVIHSNAVESNSPEDVLASSHNTSLTSEGFSGDVTSKMKPSTRHASDASRSHQQLRFSDDLPAVREDDEEEKEESPDGKAQGGRGTLEVQTSFPSSYTIMSLSTDGGDHSEDVTRDNYMHLSDDGEEDDSSIDSHMENSSSDEEDEEDEEDDDDNVVRRQSPRLFSALSTSTSNIPYTTLSSQEDEATPATNTAPAVNNPTAGSPNLDLSSKSTSFYDV